MVRNGFYLQHMDAALLEHVRLAFMSCRPSRAIQPQKPHWQYAFYGKPAPKYEIEDMPAQMAERMMADISELIGDDLEGFTLFNKGVLDGKDRGWQMSIRRKSELGWNVQTVTAEEAHRVFSMIQAKGHPDGPLTVKLPQRGLVEMYDQLQREAEKLLTVLRDHVV